MFLRCARSLMCARILLCVSRIWYLKKRKKNKKNDGKMLRPRRYLDYAAAAVVLIFTLVVGLPTVSGKFFFWIFLVFYFLSSIWKDHAFSINDKTCILGASLLLGNRLRETVGAGAFVPISILQLWCWLQIIPFLFSLTVFTFTPTTIGYRCVSKHGRILH